MFWKNKSDRQEQRLKRELFSWFRLRLLQETWRDEDIDALVEVAMQALEKMVADAQASNLEDG